MASNQNIRINIDLVGNASKAKTAINQVQSALNGLNTDKLGKGVTSTVDKLQTEISKFEINAFKDSADSKDLQAMSKNIQNIIAYSNKLQSELSGLTGKEYDLIPEGALKQFEQAYQLASKYEDSLDQINLKIASATAEANKIKAQKNKLEESISKKKQNLVSDDEYANAQAKWKATQNLQRAALNEYKKQVGTEGELSALANYESAIKKSQEAKKNLDSMYTNDLYQKDIQSLEEINIEYQKQIDIITKLASSKKELFNDVKNNISESLGGVDLSNIVDQAGLNKFLQNLPTGELEKVIQNLILAQTELQDLGKVANDTDSKIADSAMELDKLSYSAQQVAQLKNQLLSFFSVGNGIQLFKRMIRGAIDTISDLDAAMTETAVVTDFSVSDMWGRLREYTDLANKLGATTQGAYETMTLYYQQGLDTKATFELGEETMKMARIAGMDYSEATDMMTAALRGFNMELNQTSAQHINDVYSELAAITASDTYEISEAMTRTASIAASAGLDFDVASAYLAEAIETTREAPENIGTAMKTIVARFASLTKDPASLSQEMQDALGGEVVEANRVEAALKSAGVEARDSSGNFRNLSDVFLELNSKWDSLDLMTQRYVATQAAGTRQQSRFIAMMQNYDRTMELVNAAQNSAGASQKQFEKTLDSMEAKVNKLKNAWNEFAMNIANSDMVKAGVDALTGFLTIINKISEAVTKIVPGKGLDGIVKSLMNIGTIIGAMKIGGSILNGDLFRGSIGKEKSTRKTGVQGAADTIFQDKASRRLKPNGYIEEGQQAGIAFNSGIEKAIQKANFKTFKKTLRDSFTDVTKDGDLVNGDLSKISDKFKDLPNSVKENLNKINFSKGLQNAFDASLKGVNLDASAKQKAIEFKKEIETYLKQGDIEGAINVASIRSTDLGGTGNINYANFGGQYSGLDTITQGLNSFSNKCISGASALDDISQAMYAAGFDKTAIALQTFSSILFGLNGVIKGVEAATIALNAALMAEGGIKNFLAGKIGIGEGKFGKTKDAFGRGFGNVGRKTAQSLYGGSPFAQGLYGLNKKDKLFGKTGRLTKAFGTAASEGGGGLIGVFSKILSIVTKIPGPILAIGAAIGVAAAAWKIYDNNFSPEAKLEKATQAATQAQTVLNETQSAYNKLTEGKNNLDTLAEGFDGLVEGTTAWKEQMLDSNAAIIELGHQFPDLLKYTETLSNGMMQISDEGWDKVLQKQQEALTNASAVSTISAGRQAEAQSVVDAKKLKKENGWATGAWTENNSKELNNILEQGTQSYLSSLETAMTTVVSSNDNISNKYTEGISQILSNQYEDMVDQQLSNLGSKKDIKEAWAKQNGWEWKEDNTYTNKATGAEQEFDFKTVKSQLADAKALDQATKSAERLSEELTKADAKTDGLFSKLMSKDASIDAQDLAKLQDTSNIEKMIDEYQSATSDKQFAQALADYLNVDVESVETNVEKYKKELSSVLSSNVDDIANAQKEQSESLATLLLATVDKQDNKEIYKSASQINEKDIANIESLISNLSTEQRNTFNRVATQIQETLGTDAMNTFLDATLNNPKINNSSEDLQKINNAISDIDWSNPINAAGELSKYLESDNEVLQNFAEEMLNSGEACITAADQMQYFFSSNEWADLTDEVQDFIKTNGEVTADNVRELADENVNLQQIMENTNTTATTMGLIMTELGRNGEFAVTSITESLLALLSGFGKLDNTISNTINELEGFDPGIDEGAAADSLKSWTEAINGFWNNGEVGNSQLQNYLKKMFGQDQWQQALNEAGGDLAKAEGKLVKRAQVFAGENMQAAWSDLANNKSAVNALEKAGISVKEGTDGVISITDQGKDKITKTTDELVQAISEAYKVDPTTAAAMLTDFKNYSADFAKEVEAADITKSFDEKAFANSLKTSFVGADGALKQGQSILASDLKNTAQILKDSNVDTSKQIEYWTNALKAMGYTDDQIATFNIEAMVNSSDEAVVDEFIERLKQETSKDHTFIIDPKVDKNGVLDLDNLEKQLNDFSSSQEGWTKKFKNNFKLDNGAFDGVAMAKELQKIGINADQATQYITKLSDEGGQISINGEIVDSADIDSELATALDPLNDPSQYAGMASAIGDAIAKALTNLDITIDDDKITISGKNPDGKLEEVAGDSTSTKDKTSKPNANKKHNDHQKAATLARKNLNTKESNNTKTSDKSEKEIKKIQKQQKSSGNKNFGKKAESFLKQGKTRDTSQGGGGHTTWKKNASTTSTKKGKKSDNKSEITNVKKLQKAYDKLSAKEKERSGLNNKVGKNLLSQSSSVKKISTETAKTSKSNKQIEANTKKKQKPVKTKIKTDTKGITKDINKATKKVEKTKIKANVDTKNISKQTSKAVKQGNKGSKVEVKADTKSIDQAAQKAKKIEGGKIKYTADTSSLPKVGPTLSGGIKYKGNFPKKGNTVKGTVNYKRGKQEGPTDKKAKVSYSTSQSSTITIKVKARAKGQNLAGAAAFGSAAKGAQRGKLGPNGKGGPTLTGELGQELVWEPNTSDSYLVGTEGPEIVNLPQNAVVWPANQTKKILKGNSKNPKVNSLAKGKNFGTAATGYGGITSSYTSSSRKGSSGKKGSSGGGGSSSTKKLPKTWENPYDEFYNLQKAINKEIRIRENLEKQYNLLLKQENTSYKNLSENLKKHLATIKETIQDTQDYMNNKRVQAQNYIESSKKASFVYNKENGAETRAENIDLTQYGGWDSETNTIYINWDEINKIAQKEDKKSSTYWQEYGGAIEDYISKLEEIQDDFEDAEDKWYDAQEEFYSLIEDYRDKNIDAQNKVAELIKEQDQNTIDKLSEVNESINDANDRITDSIQKNIDRIRKQRENEKTEEDLTDKEKRLAYLKQDTSGANAVEIKQLEKEIQEARRDYQDTLVDDSLDNFQNKLEEAAEQRERQIELLEKQLEYNETNGIYQQMAIDAINNSISEETGEFIKGSLVELLLLNSADYKAAGPEEQEKLLEELIDSVLDFKSYLNLKEEKNSIGASDSGTVKTVNGSNYVGGTGHYAPEEDVEWNEDKTEGTYTWKEGSTTYTANVSRNNQTGELEWNNIKATTTTLDKNATAQFWNKGKIATGKKDVTQTSTYELDKEGNIIADSFKTTRTYDVFGASNNSMREVTTYNAEDASVASKRQQIYIPKKLAIWDKDGKESAVYTQSAKWIEWNDTLEDTSNHNKFIGITRYKDQNNKWVTRAEKVLKYTKPSTLIGKFDSTNASNIYSLQYALSQLGYYDGELDGVYNSELTKGIKEFQETYGRQEYKGKIYYTNNNGTVDDATLEYLKLLEYKTGGIADFTGPAWLDGTKSKPELVLNAKDTANFIMLKDVLSGIMSNGVSTSTSDSNNTYNINIDVKEISNDYDVDQMINKVKKEITKAASNRNVNTISRRR